MSVILVCFLTDDDETKKILHTMSIDLAMYESYLNLHQISPVVVSFDWSFCTRISFLSLLLYFEPTKCKLPSIRCIPRWMVQVSDHRIKIGWRDRNILHLKISSFFWFQKRYSWTYSRFINPGFSLKLIYIFMRRYLCDEPNVLAHYYLIYFLLSAAR